MFEQPWSYCYIAARSHAPSYALHSRTLLSRTTPLAAQARATKLVPIHRSLSQILFIDIAIACRLRKRVAALNRRTGHDARSTEVNVVLRDHTGCLLAPKHRFGLQQCRSNRPPRVKASASLPKPVLKQ